VNDTYSIGNVRRPAFLSLPERSAKPRDVGLTHVLDKGQTVQSTQSVLLASAPLIDVWKFGWGTAYIDTALIEKLALLRAADIRTCLGGTLLEISWAQGKAQECLDWAAEVGFDAVEVSRGVAPMTVSDKRELLCRATESFEVLSEVGSKDPQEVLTPDEWTSEVAGDIAAGAAVRGGGIDRILFEAPRKDQQAWLIRTFGPDVNLANIACNEVLALETLRLGLRADTCDVTRTWQLT